MGMPRFVLASASPARLQLLRHAGIAPLVVPSHYDESQVQTSNPQQLVQTLAQGKAETVAAQLAIARLLPMWLRENPLDVQVVLP